MDSRAHFDNAGLADSTAAASDGAPSALIEAATVEFLSTLQLLAERARSVTGADRVAIALQEEGSFVYRASVGGAAELGSSADKCKAPVAKCVATAKPSTVSAHSSQGQIVKAAVPVTRQGEVVGFFEVSASRSSFSDEDVLAISDLADMVNTALDHMQAAKAVREQGLDSCSGGRPQQLFSAKPETPPPFSWHAAEDSLPAKVEVRATAVSAPLTVHVCHSCGFPISDGRSLCVECEQKPDAPKPPEPKLLGATTQASWITAHGYTIATLLVTALVAAIIYWLR